ncbi:hypothetical protein AXG93_3818s1520 [Marchantia polymorpha subsp. ruderalis]|uniref:Uncharacterized protein n=1 Tax=Marchantia polymorpha subsp. ruderalis TaxID=1480154 RepID=A0A176VIB9_MARPO|nr:hypothetical protein AXG93_3818s1520 [Marchantia polymorpha subsp. ruderalis]
MAAQNQSQAFKLYEDDRQASKHVRGGIGDDGHERRDHYRPAEDPSKRFAMSQVVNMLVGYSGLAIDLINELECQKLKLDDIFDGLIVDERLEEQQVRCSDALNCV